MTFDDTSIEPEHLYIDLEIDNCLSVYFDFKNLPKNLNPK